MMVEEGQHASVAAAPAAPSEEAGAGTRRFRQKRDAILAAAAEAINEQSAKGMTFADVARRVGLNTTSVTYYFRRKEDLAAAAFEHTLDTLGAMLAEAAAEATPQARVARWVSLNLARLARIERGEESAFAVLSDLRATEGAVHERLMAGWQRVFRATRDLWGRPAGRAQKDLNGARAHVLLENTFWLPVWLARYDLDQYGRVEERLMDVLRGGIARPAAAWAPEPIELTHDAVPAREAFLLAATRLINELGYHGASVQRISAELNVTKGSFYHHLDAKDNLVLECFRRSLAAVSDAQDAAAAAPGDKLRQLTSVLAALLDVQLSDRMPLLRTTALLALPQELRTEVMDRTDRIALRFAGLVTDGITEGSLAPVDPVIAGQVLLSSLNAAYELRERAARLPAATGVALYGDVLLHGVLRDA